VVYRLLADENVDRIPTLGKGADDEEIATYSIDDDRSILTSDDDFLREFDASEHAGLLFIEDETFSSATIADVVHAISEHVGQDEIEDVFYVSTNRL